MTAASSTERAPSLRVGVITLFPELFSPFICTSFVGRAIDGGIVTLELVPLREFGLGRHKSVDDTPYGGGSGMVIRVDCVAAAIEDAERKLGGRAHRVLMTPQGEPLVARSSKALATKRRLLLICGRYEGFDERVRSMIDQEISLGDFVLTGGEIPAMAVIESTIRFLPGVLGNENSAREESFSSALGGGLEYPQFTRPSAFRGETVPEVLTSGDHGRIEAWRRQQAAERTRQRRPDLLRGGRNEGEK